MSSFFNKYKLILNSSIIGATFGLILFLIQHTDVYVYYYRFSKNDVEKIPTFCVNDTLISLNKDILVSNYQKDYSKYDSYNDIIYSDFKIYAKKGEIDDIRNTINKKLNKKHLDFIHLSFERTASISKKMFHFGIAGFFIGILFYLYSNKNKQLQKKK